MAIPAFSMFSAVSELFVTAGVLWIVWRNWTRRPFPLGAFLAVALFEALVNVLYMANRAAQAADGRQTLGTGMKIAFAAHGMLSLIAYLVFVILAVFAYQEQREGRWFFRGHQVITWSFLVLWVISIGSGEVLFALRYLVPRA